METTTVTAADETMIVPPVAAPEPQGSPGTPSSTSAIQEPADDPHTEPTSSPVEPDPNQTQPSEDVVTDPATVVVEPEDDEDDEYVEQPLPETLAEATTELKRLRRLYYNLTLRDQQRRRQINKTNALNAQLTAEVAKLEGKLTAIANERDVARTQVSAVETSQSQWTEERERYRQYWLTRFPEGTQREIAERTPLDLLPKLHEEFNGNGTVTKKEEPATPSAKQDPPPSSSRQIVTRTPGSKPAATTFSSHFGVDKGK